MHWESSTCLTFWLAYSFWELTSHPCSGNSLMVFTVKLIRYLYSSHNRVYQKKNHQQHRKANSTLYSPATRNLLVWKEHVCVYWREHALKVCYTPVKRKKVACYTFKANHECCIKEGRKKQSDILPGVYAHISFSSKDCHNPVEWIEMLVFWIGTKPTN